MGYCRYATGYVPTVRKDWFLSAYGYSEGAKVGGNVPKHTASQGIRPLSYHIREKVCVSLSLATCTAKRNKFEYHVMMMMMMMMMMITN